MNTIESLQWRYAVKKFDDTKLLTTTQINTLKEAFNLTATSYGLQPVKMVIINNKEIQQQLVEHSWNQQQILQASHVLVLCIPKTYSGEDVKQYFDLVQKTRNTSEEIIGKFRDFLVADINKKSQETLFTWNKNQAYIALGNLMTVCAIEQIDACPMEGFVPEKYDEILKLNKQNLTSVLVLPVGFRAEDDYMKDLKKVRKQTSDVIIEL